MNGHDRNVRFRRKRVNPNCSPIPFHLCLYLLLQLPFIVSRPKAQTIQVSNQITRNGGQLLYSVECSNVPFCKTDVSSSFRQSSANVSLNSSIASSGLPSPKGPPYPYADQSFSSSAGSQSSMIHSSVSPIYGDSTLITPNKRINRRYL